MGVFITKRSIFTQSGATWASEILYKENLPVTNAEGVPDENLTLAAQLDEEQFFREKTRELFKKGRIYIRLTPSLLTRNIAEVFVKQRLIIEITPEIMLDEGAIAKITQLKKLGYVIAITPFLYQDEHKELFKFVDIVRFPISADHDAVELTVEKCKEYKKECIADNVESEDEHEYAKEIGVDYISGYYFAKPVIETKRSGKPMIKTFLQIVAMLYSKNPDIEQIAAVISTDPVLTIRLLRLINQMCADTGNTVSTVHQALVMLGLDKLKEWIYLVGLQRLNRDAPTELLRLALFRASFCENLGRVVPGVGTRSKELYLMGLISIITGTAGKRLAEALEELPVSQDIKQGLMGGGGVFSDIFYLSHNYERGNWDKVEFYIKRCKIDNGVLNMVYLNSARFTEGFSEFNK